MHGHGRAAVALWRGGDDAGGDRGRIAGYRDAVEHGQGDYDPERPVGRKPEHGGEHARRQHDDGDGFVAADAAADFVAQNAGRHAQQIDDGGDGRGAPRSFAARPGGSGEYQEGDDPRA